MCQTGEVGGFTACMYTKNFFSMIYYHEKVWEGSGWLHCPAIWLYLCMLWLLDQYSPLVFCSLFIMCCNGVLLYHEYFLLLSITLFVVFIIFFEEVMIKHITHGRHPAHSPLRWHWSSFAKEWKWKDVVQFVIQMIHHCSWQSFIEVRNL